MISKQFLRTLKIVSWPLTAWNLAGETRFLSGCLAFYIKSPKDGPQKKVHPAMISKGRHQVPPPQKRFVLFFLFFYKKVEIP
ncbi:MAG: hypothetical protein J5965_04880 [Aeriscardovia sp.]|nr:hypothetical protein [Aeriscardovia sp.]